MGGGGVSRGGTRKESGKGVAAADAARGQLLLENCCQISCQGVCLDLTLRLLERLLERATGGQHCLRRSGC